MELIIDAQPFDLEGFCEHNASIGRLLVTASSRGGNRRLPNLAGRRPYPIQVDEVVVDLELEVFGDVDHAGVAYADPFVGLSDNLLFLQDFVLDRMGAAATVPAVLNVDGGRTFEADVQILNLQLARHAITMAYVSYDLRIPAGRWTETT